MLGEQLGKARSPLRLPSRSACDERDMAPASVLILVLFAWLRSLSWQRHTETDPTEGEWGFVPGSRLQAG